MFWQHSKPKPPRGKTDKIIEAWLKERETLWRLYVKLGELVKAGKAGQQPSNPTELQAFRATLIDYVAAGHFQVFETLAEADAQSSTTSLYSTLLPKILHTKDIASAFDDKYHQVNSWDELSQDLSNLGEHLADRREWENALIRQYLKMTKEPPAPGSSRAPAI